MKEWFVFTQSFAAPFFGDSGDQYVEAASAEDALMFVSANYKHPAGLFSAAAYPSADAMHKGEKPTAVWLCNHEIEKRRLTRGMGAYTFLGHSPGVFEIDGVRHEVRDPKNGRCFPSLEDA